MGNTEVEQDGWPSPEDKTKSVAKAKGLREQARIGGLRFEAYLPPDLADWLLGLVEEGAFLDPSEAVFVILGEHRDLGPHADLQQELLKRMIQSAADDTRPGIPAEEVFAKLEKQFAAPQPEPAVWKPS